MNIDEYVNFASQLVRSNIDPLDGSITAAKLGTLLRRSSPVTWEQLGFRSLKDFLLLLEQRRLVRLGENTKNAFAVWLASASSNATLQSNFSSEHRGPSFAPLKKPFWVAFAVERPTGLRFFNGVSHEIRLGLSELPAPPSDWIKIDPVAPSEQKDWAREFVVANGLKHRSELEASLFAPDWYQTFSRLLGLLKAELAKEWNRQRSDRVARHIQSWCQRNAINPGIAFQGPGEQSLSGDVQAAPTVGMSAPSAVRDAVLRALARMPTSELLEIPIPSKYVLGIGPNDEMSE